MRASSTALTSRVRIASACSSADANGSIRGDLAYRNGGEGTPHQRGFELGRPVGREGDQEAPAGLGVAEQQAFDLGQAIPVDDLGDRLVVAAGAAGEEVALGQLANAR